VWKLASPTRRATSPPHIDVRSDFAPEHVAAAEKAGLTIIGEATRDPYLHISHNGTTLIDSPIDQLKPLWKDGLVKYC